MMHGNIREILQDVGHGEVQGDLSPRVAPLQQVLYVLVLPDELLLHGIADANKSCFT